jgi:formyltetrahydrofolate-dependent phosphoribosylglycinamide formyltransferase
VVQHHRALKSEFFEFISFEFASLKDCMQKIFVFASGGGSNFKAIHQRLLSDSWNAQIAGLITNSSRCGAAEYARANGIPVFHISAMTHPDESERTSHFLDVCAGGHWLVLAGYMKKLPEALVHAFKHRILNIHPSLLPAFGGEGCYGIHVHEKAIQRGVRIAGATVHLVTEDYDEGPILWQESLVVSPDDTAESLQKRVLAIEHAIYPKVVKHLLDFGCEFDLHGRPCLRGKDWDPT